MSVSARNSHLSVSARSSLIGLLVSLLAFPPQILADGITWNGGTGNYNDPAQWTCGTCSPPTYPNNGNNGLTFEALINTGSDDVTLNVTAIVNSMGIGGSGGSSILTVQGGNSLTFGTPTVVTGNVLNVGNGGMLNVQSGSAAILELSSPNGATANIDTNGQINVQNGGTLTINNSNNSIPAVITNAGTVSIGDGTGPGTLTLNVSGAGSMFTIPTPTCGSGLSGLGENAGTLIQGKSGMETLTIQGGTNLSGAGTISVANFTNGGTLGASFTDNALIVNSNLTNWTAATASTLGTLSGGQYIASGTLQLSSIGLGNSIQTLTNANIVLTGSSALITGDGATNALSGLTNITDASLNLSGQGTALNPLTITPSGGTLTMTSDPNGTSNLNLDGDSNVTVSGGFHNLTTTDTNPNTGTVNIQGGSTLTVTGNFLNEADVDANLISSTSTVNVLGGSTLNVDSLTTSTNNGFANSNINVTGSSLNVTHDLLQGGAGPNFSGGDDTLNLTNSTATVGGNFQNNNGLNTSAVNLNNSSLTVDGTFTQTQTNGGFGQSQLNLTNNSIMTVGGFTNYSGVQGANIPQSLVSITGGSTLNILGTNTFTNAGGGTLSGGSYFVGTGSSLNYTGTNIGTIDTNTVLTLDNTDGGIQGAILNGGNDAISNSLTTVNGTLALQNGTNITLSGLPSSTTFTVGANGTLSALNSSNLDFSAYNFGNVNSSGLLSGGNYVIGSNSTLNYSGVSDITEIDANTSLTLDNRNGGTTGSFTNAGLDAVSGTLTSVNGTLALQNGASLTLSGEPDGTFTVGPNGTLSIQNILNPVNGQPYTTKVGSLDISAYTFTNVNGTTGLLSGGNYLVGTNSTLNYSGTSNITGIDVNTSLTLDNIANGNTGSITNAGVDALSNSLTTNNGNLTLQNLANLALGQGLTNSSADTAEGSASANLNLTGGSTLTLNNGLSDFTNIATSSNGNNSASTVSLHDGSTMTVNNLYNTAVNTTTGFAAGSASASINLTNESSLAVNGNLVNTTNSSFGAAAASINLDGGSSLTVGGTYNNTGTSGNIGAGSSLNLINASTATITGLFTNDAFSTVNLDLTGNGGSILTTNGGFSNAGSVVLDFLSSLNNTGIFSNSGTINLNNVSTLTTSGLLDNSNGTLNLNGGGNTLFAQGLTNNGGTIYVAAGDTADFRTGGTDTFTNLTNGTLNGGAYNIGGLFLFDASAGTGGGQLQNLSGGASVTINGSGQMLYGVNGSQGDALLAVTNMSLSTLAFNDVGAYTITPVPTAGISTLTMTDSYLNLSSSATATQTSLTIAGNLVNNSNVGNSTVNLTGSNLTVDGSINNSNNGSFSSAINLNSAILDTGSGSVLAGSTLTATGVLINGVDNQVNLNGGGNQFIATGLTNNGSISIGSGDTMDVRNGGLGVLTNLDATGALNNAGAGFDRASYSIGGQLFYDTGMGGATSITTLNGVNMTLSGTGALLYGAGSGNDALSTLATLNNSGLTVSAQTRTISPTGPNPTFALNSSSSLTLQNGANLTLNAFVNNDSTSSISLSGSGNILYGHGFSNGISTGTGGTLSVDSGSTADFRTGGTDTFSNLSNGALSGGTYTVGGTFDFDASTGTGLGQFQTINNADVTINGTGQILYGVNGSQHDALAAVTNMNNSSLTFNDVNTKSIAPVGATPTLTLTDSSLSLSSSALATQTNLTIDGNLAVTRNSGFASASLSGSNLTVDGTVTTSGGSWASVNLSSASLYNGTNYVNTGSTLTATGALINGADSSITLNGGGNQLIANGLTNNGSIIVGQNDTMDVSHGGTGVLTNLSAGVLTNGGPLFDNSSYDISGQFKFGTGSDGSTLVTGLNDVNLTLRGSGAFLNGSGNDALTNLNSLTNSSLTLYNQTRSFNVGTAFTLDPSHLTLNGSTMTVNGGINNNSGSSITLSTYNGVSTLSATGGPLFNDAGSTVTLNGGGNSLTALGLTNNGTITIQQGDTADFRTGGTDTFTNLTNGTLSGGTYYVAGTFEYDPTSSAATGYINKIGTGTTLTLDGSGAAAVLFGSSGTDGMQNLTDIAGTFNLGYSSQTNTLTRNYMPTTGTLNVESTGQFNLGSSFGSGVANITGSLANGGSMTLENLSGVTTTTGATNTGNLYAYGTNFITGPSFSNTGTLVAGTNGAEFLDIRTGGTNTFSNLDGTTGTLGGGGTFNVGGSFLFDPSSKTAGGNIYVIGAGTTLALTDAASQVLYGGGSGTDAIASLTEITGTLTLENSATHTFTPTTGTLTIDSPGTMNISGSDATATVSGALTNNGALNISGAYGTHVEDVGYEALNVSGALTNGSGGTVTMNSYSSVLNIGAGLTNNGTFNVSNDLNTVNVTGAVANNNALTISGYQNVLNVTGDLMNAGAFTQSDNSSTTVNIGSNLQNLAAGTYTVGYGNTTNVTLAASNAATGTINVNGGGTLAVTLGVDNSGAINVGANEGWGTSGGLLSAGAPFVNETGSSLSVYSGSTVTAPGFTNNGTLSVLAGGLANFQGGGAGSFTNLSGGTLTGGSYVIGGTFQFDSANGIINNIASGTSLTLDAQNSGAYAVQSGTNNALLNLSGNAGSLTLTNGASLNADTTANGGPGVFTNSGSLTTSGGTGSIGANAFGVTGAFTNTSTGSVNLNYAGDSLAATGLFTNQGGLGLAGNNAFVSSAGFDNQAKATITFTGTGNRITSSAAVTNEGSIQMNGITGTLSTQNFTNTGTVTTAGGGSNAVNATGAIFNTSPGVVNLNGAGDQMTATGAFTNTGSVTLNGSNAAVSSVGLDNQSGGTVTLAGGNNSVASTSTASNEGTIAFNGTNGTVSSTGDFTNAATGIMTIDGLRNAVTTQENLFNSGAITMGDGGSLTAALGFNQSGGNVTINSGGQLTVLE